MSAGQLSARVVRLVDSRDENRTEPWISAEMGKCSPTRTNDTVPYGWRNCTNNNTEHLI